MIHPSKTTFTDEEHDEIRAEVRLALAGPPKLKQADLARQTGIADSIISSYLSAKYEGDNNKPALTLKKWLDARDRAAVVSARTPVIPEFQALQASQLLLALMDQARVSGDIVSVISPPGLSKTTTALRYASSTPRAWYVAIDESTHGVQPMLLEILSAMGKKNITGSPAQLRRMVVDEALEAPGVIIIDEANILSEKALNQIRAINDATERMGKPVGIVLLSNPMMNDKIGTGSTKPQFAQMSSRIGQRRVILAPDQRDVATLAWAWANANGEHLTTDALQLCQDMAAKAGGLRNVSKAFKNALMVTMANGQPLEAEHLRGAFHQLYGIWL
ncbi:AAA family ATPase [Caulobacter sp. SL161]|uniref:AAA family ATPase n=1 Tax=Caulobacter sp. SL161 TaxID=2995156 RepID=UPI0022748EEA|nr:AAA family ATPase [Caulobacter sp. SL161]MCY1648148.1 AAA family ATPase [Caulobacter sp. SL161]